VLTSTCVRACRPSSDLKCRVHGGTGGARQAPRSLADYLKLDQQEDLQRIMDFLAEQRANACRKALVEMGVPEGQLFVTARGCSGRISVEFTPMPKQLSPPPGLPG
jgi:hypothetical protein